MRDMNLFCPECGVYFTRHAKEALTCGFVFFQGDNEAGWMPKDQSEIAVQARYERTCLVCDRIDCTCMSNCSPRSLGAYNTEYMGEIYQQMTDPRNRWPDGREDKAAEWLRKELVLRGAIQEFKQSKPVPAFALYRQ